jgi:nucleoside-diphosphate-sugar epimerase
MRILILGSTGRIGRLVLKRALADGHDVVVLVRQPPTPDHDPRLVPVVGDITDPTAIAHAIPGVAAVIAAVGPRANTAGDADAVALGMHNLITAMHAEGVQRLIALSGAGVDVPGDDKPLVDRLASRVVRRLARHVVTAKQREYELVAASGLRWTALRPPLVGDGPAQGYLLSDRLRPGARVTRTDVADALADQLTRDAHVRSAPFVLPAVRREGSR